MLTIACHAGGLMLGALSPHLMPTLPPPIQVPRTHISDTNFFYNIPISAISLGGHDLPVSVPDFEAGYGALLDSGTTFTFLPSKTALAFERQLVLLVKQAGFKRVRGLPSRFCFATFVPPPRLETEF
jgi:hypothetical protein